jgi:hypothetical protein
MLKLIFNSRCISNYSRGRGKGGREGSYALPQPPKISLNLVEFFKNFMVAHPHPFTRGNYHSTTHQIRAINSSSDMVFFFFKCKFLVFFRLDKRKMMICLYLIKRTVCFKIILKPLLSPCKSTQVHANIPLVLAFRLHGSDN